jgi:hypothetical protein
MPKVGKKKFPYTKVGVAAANLAAAKSGKKVRMAPGKMYAGGSRDFNERTGTYRSTGTKRSPKVPKNLERMPRIKTRAK